MLVSCLTATYGRYSVLCEAITCFIEQDYENKELIILNTHPIPIICDLPQVKVFNETEHSTLGDCRNRLINLINGDLVRTWDDDDLYLPWAISQGVENIGDAPAWKPLRSWSWRVDKDQVLLNGNKYEAAWTTKADIIKKYGYLSRSGGNEHNPLELGIKEEGGIVKTDVGAAKASYAYRWGSGLCRISGTLDKTKDNIEWRTDRWKRLNDDHGFGEPIKPVDLTPYWDRIKEAVDSVDKN